MQPMWFRNAVIYQVDVAQFRDADGDGWGDLRGVAERLEYIRGLGANCIWLLPFYPSPYRDGGYDVTDHLAVDPRFGDLADAALLLDKADALGMRVIVDLVAQHTSVEHPWFQQARRDRSSPYRDYYVWADEPEDHDVEQIFPTVEDGIWAWDDEAGQYYRHTFYSHEPDLDLSNPRVREELDRVMAFWLRMGVAGFRVDALPYMVERARAADPDQDGLWLVEHMHDVLSLRRADAVLLGEVDVPVDEYDAYLRDGRRMTMLLDFWTNNHTFLALARGDQRPVRHALTSRPAAPRRTQYAHFLRNHDELDLERLSADDRDEVVATFAPDESMRAYGRGIRRRLAPMLEGDDRRIAMAHALLMSLPGIPVLLYGDEIGMGDDLGRAERLSVRTPMQWSTVPNAGFSPADPGDLVAPVVSEGRYAYQEVNVHRQTMEPDSLLARVSNLVRTRIGRHEIGFGRFEVVDTDADQVLCLQYDEDGSRLLCAVNLGADEVVVDLGDADLGALVDVLADAEYPEPGADGAKLRLHGYGYRWLQRPEDVLG